MRNESAECAGEPITSTRRYSHHSRALTLDLSFIATPRRRRSLQRPSSHPGCTDHTCVRGLLVMRKHIGLIPAQGAQ
jgi:hypothetical protein